jgi:hypothetical protein
MVRGASNRQARRCKPCPFSGGTAPLILVAETRQVDRDKAWSDADSPHREEPSESELTLPRQNTDPTVEVAEITRQVQQLTQEIHTRVLATCGLWLRPTGGEAVLSLALDGMWHRARLVGPSPVLPRILAQVLSKPGGLSCSVRVFPRSPVRQCRAQSILVVLPSRGSRPFPSAAEC